MTVITAHDTQGSVDWMEPEMLMMQARGVITVGLYGILVFINQSVPAELRFLYALTLGCHPDRFVEVRVDGRGTVTLVNPAQQALLATATSMSVFSGTSEQIRWVSKVLGLPLTVPNLEICRDGNSKVKFQSHGRCVRPEGDSFVVNGSPVEEALVPDGGYAEQDQLYDLLQFLFQEFSHTHYRIKPDSSASCIGHMTVGRNVTCEDLAHLELGMYVVQKAMAKGFKEVSVPFRIEKGGDGYTIAICGQHIVTRHGQDDFVGNFSLRRELLSNELRQKILTAARFHIKQQVKRGYFGWGSVDFGINFETGEVCAFEVNCRTTATYYPITASRTMFDGERRPFDNQSFLIPAGMSLEALLQRFDGLILQPGSDTGFVPYCFLQELGFSYGVCYAPDYSALAALVAEVNRRKLALAA